MDETTQALERIGALLEGINERVSVPNPPNRPIWPHYLGFTVVLIGVFVGCAAYTQANTDSVRGELIAQRLALSDMFMRLKADPKNDSRIDKALDQLIEYYREKLHESRD